MGLSKDFILFIVLAVALGYFTKNPWNGIVLMLIYGSIKGTWRLLTIKRDGR